MSEGQMVSGMKLVLFGVGVLATAVGYLVGDEVRRRIDEHRITEMTEQFRVLPTCDCNCRCEVDVAECQIATPPDQWPEDKNRPDDWYDE